MNHRSEGSNPSSSGAGVFTVNKYGIVKVNKSAYNQALNDANNSSDKLDLLKAVKNIVTHRKTVEVYMFDSDERAIVKRDPKDKDNNSIYRQKNGEEGYIVVVPKSKAGGTFQRDPDNTLVIITDPNAQFTAKKNNQDVKLTNPSESSLLFHELLDHFYEEKILKNIPNIDPVKWHSRALRNIGSIERNGEDHD